MYTLQTSKRDSRRALAVQSKLECESPSITSFYVVISACTSSSFSAQTTFSSHGANLSTVCVSVVFDHATEPGDASKIKLVSTRKELSENDTKKKPFASNSCARPCSTGVGWGRFGVWFGGGLGAVWGRSG